MQSVSSVNHLMPKPAQHYYQRHLQNLLFFELLEKMMLHGNCKVVQPFTNELLMNQPKRQSAKKRATNLQGKDD